MSDLDEGPVGGKVPLRRRSNTSAKTFVVPALSVIGGALLSAAGIPRVVAIPLAAVFAAGVIVWGYVARDGLLRRVSRYPVGVAIAIAYCLAVPAVVIASNWAGGLLGTIIAAAAAAVVSTVVLVATLEAHWLSATCAGLAMLAGVVGLLAGVAVLRDGQLLLGVAGLLVGVVGLLLSVVILRDGQLLFGVPILLFGVAGLLFGVVILRDGSRRFARWMRSLVTRYPQPRQEQINPGPGVAVDPPARGT